LKLEAPLFISLRKASANATDEYLLSRPVERGQQWRVELVSCEDETTAFTYLRIGIRRGGIDAWLEEEKTPSAGTRYWMNDPFWLAEGERLVVRFNGTTLGDKLAVDVKGAIARV